MSENPKPRTSTRSPVLAESLLLAAASALLFLALVFEDFDQLRETDWSEQPMGLIVRYFVAMGLGGAVAGYALSNLFGRSGLLGWVLAAMGGILVATFAGLLGSAIGLLPDLVSNGFQTPDILAVSAGALVLPLALIGWPTLLPIWIGLIFLVHILAKR